MAVGRAVPQGDLRRGLSVAALLLLHHEADLHRPPNDAREGLADHGGEPLLQCLQSEGATDPDEELVLILGDQEGVLQPGVEVGPAHL